MRIESIQEVEQAHTKLNVAVLRHFSTLFSDLAEKLLQLRFLSMICNRIRRLPLVLYKRLPHLHRVLYKLTARVVIFSKCLFVGGRAGAL